MKIVDNTILAMGFIACLFAFSACENNNLEPVRDKTALVTIYPGLVDNFTMQLDEFTSLIPTNIKASPFGSKKVRALVNYKEESIIGSYCGNYREVMVSVDQIDSIRTKQPVPTQGEVDGTVFGNDPIEIVRDWVTVAEDGFVTLRIRTRWGNNAKHIINLISGVNKDNLYEFDLRHNAQGDMQGNLGDTLIAFDLNDFWENHPSEVKIKINWLSFTGKKSIEFELKMHPASAANSSEKSYHRA